jgi:hypothetical protein
LANFYNLSLSISAFTDELNDLAQICYGETSTVHCVPAADTNSNIGVLYSNEIISPVSDHTYLHRALPKDLLQHSAIPHLLSDGLFVSFHNQRLVLWGNPCKDFDLIVKEGSWVLLDEIVVDRVDDIAAFLQTLKLEVVDLPLGFLDLPVLVNGQLRYILGIVCSLFPLDNDHPFLPLNHPCEEGSLDTQEDVVARDDLGVDAAISERFDGLYCILLQLIVESYDSEEGVVLEEVLPITLQIGPHFLLVNLLQPKGDASVAI